MDRRAFVGSAVSIVFAPQQPQPCSLKTWPRLRFGICADLHYDLMDDGRDRLSQFVEAMSRERPDFVIQMGDFCHPEPVNREVMTLWNRIPAPTHHVIGNHDLERKYTRQMVCEFLGSPAPFYSFEAGAYHCVILDGNEQNPAHPNASGYNRFLSNAQLHWLAEDLRKTDRHTLVFLHQGLDAAENGVENAVTVRLVLEQANALAGFTKVIAVFTGHHHQDYYNLINGIHYLQINSMSYHWQDGLYVDDIFSREQKQAYPLLTSMAVYRNPLWATVEICEPGRLLVHGSKSAFLGRSPQELGMPEHLFGYPVAATITSRQLELRSSSQGSTASAIEPCNSTRRYQE